MENTMVTTPMTRDLGRQSMVNNLLGHMGTGGAAVVAGGPRMGKTTFLQQLAAAAAEAFQPVSIDLAIEPRPDPAQCLPAVERPAILPPAILLMDGCERLLPDPAPFLQQISQAALRTGSPLGGSVWAGDTRWGEWAMAHRSVFTSPIRYYPLIVLPPKEARLFLKRHWSADVPSSELEWVVELSGGHPYLLSQMVEQRERDFHAFFAELWNAADSPSERNIITQLIQAKGWVLLQDLHDEGGDDAPKPVLDRLAVTGLINRTLVDGAAAASLVSPLLSDWIRRMHHT
jgi:hypothetical protein